MVIMRVGCFFLSSKPFLLFFFFKIYLVETRANEKGPIYNLWWLKLQPEALQSMNTTQCFFFLFAKKNVKLTLF